MINCFKKKHNRSYAPGGGESYASGSDDGTVRIWRTEVKLADCAKPELPKDEQ
jgi:WD40 repeat protein